MRLLLRFLPVFVSPAIGAFVLTQGGWGQLSGYLVMFGIIPVLDALVGLDTANPDESKPARWMRVLPMFFVPAHLALLVLMLQRASTAGWSVEAVRLTLALGLGGAIAIVVAHELMHRSSSLEQRLAELIMASTTYTHFCVEHVSGHHKRVATPEDPATSRLGESLYAYLPRTILGSWRSAWGIEASRAARSGHGAWSVHNRLVLYLVAHVAIFGAVFFAFGSVGLAVFLGQSAVAIFLLETINYLEHYGLRRTESAPGRYEKVRPEHSWNASHAVSNGLLLSLARHSDHHAYVQRGYHQLRHWDGAPQLPYGYATMVLLALVPPLWFRVMDPRVRAIPAA